MNILMLVSRRQNRGAEVSASNLAKQLMEMGHCVIWTGLYSPGTDVLEVTNAITFDLVGNERSFLSLKKCRQLSWLLKKYDIDVIQANGSDTYRYAVVASFIYKKSKIVYRNISQVSFWLGKSIMKREFYRFLFRRADAIASVGTVSANDFSLIMNVASNKIKVIRRGIPGKLLDKPICRDEIFSEFGLLKNQKLLIWAGSLSEEKNPLLILDILLQLNTKRGDCFLIITGKGPEQEKLCSKINNLNLKNVSLTGYRNDIQELLAASDLLLLTSFVEGVPGVVLEAAIQQTPAIAIDRGGVSEALINNKTGILLKEHNAVEFAEKIDMLLNNEALINEMGHEAALFVRSEYDEVKNASTFVDLYQSVVNNK